MMSPSLKLLWHLFSTLGLAAGMDAEGSSLLQVADRGTVAEATQSFVEHGLRVRGLQQLREQFASMGRMMMDEDAQEVAEEVTDEQVSHQEMHQVFAAELAGMVGNSSDVAVKHLLNWLSGDQGDVPVQQLLRWAAEVHPSEPQANAAADADVHGLSAALGILQETAESRQPGRLAQAAKAGSLPENSTKAAERFRRHEERIQRLEALRAALTSLGGERERISLEMLEEELLHERVEEAIVTNAAKMNETEETGWLQGLNGDNDREVDEMQDFLRQSEMMAAMMHISTPWPSKRTQDPVSSTTAPTSSIPPSMTTAPPTRSSTTAPVATSSSPKAMRKPRPAALTTLYDEAHAFIEDVTGSHNLEVDTVSGLRVAAGFEVVSEGARPLQSMPLSEQAYGMAAVEVDSPGEYLPTSFVKSSSTV